MSVLVLVDTSAWIEFLRGTSAWQADRVEALLADGLACCEPVRMEVLAGARDERHLRDLRALLARATVLPTEAVDYEAAAALHRTCRVGGETVRRLIDCLIAAVAVRHGVTVLHADGDFDTLARHTALTVVTAA